MKTNPKARSDMTVCFGKARFQVLAERIIRMEWTATGCFEDRETLTVVNRRMKRIKFTAKTVDKKLILKTSALCLEYTDDGKPFSPKNLRVTFKLKGKRVTWFPGKKDARNLKGTARTLDEVAGGKVKLGDGLLSRNGWALVDDSKTIVLDTTEHGRPWVKKRPGGRRQDLYLFAYGNDYKSALGESACIFGRQPLPPRYALGYWWSRYWAYTDKELEGLVEEFEQKQLPIDVMVIDMDWHLEGWTGYTWDRRYFPDPKEFLAWAKQKNLKVTLNLHPADGVGKHEEQFTKMARAMGMNPEKCDHVEFDCTAPRFMDAYFKILHHPMENEGVDFWWMDWQQGTKTKMPGLDALPWLNYLHWEDMKARDKSMRPLIFSRFGGIGAGRYPIGFSGDTYSIWDSLAFQPYFTATASNVLFGYWSHDIGGHMPGAIEPELYMRWIQYGVYSPILRTHTTRNDQAERRFWEYPNPYSTIMMDAIRKRYEMTPYIYTENRKCYDTGISLCRPMYYDYPEEKEAYKATNQYMFGDSLLVAPVIRPVDEDDGMAMTDVWLPKGKWLDTAMGIADKGNRKFSRWYTLSETPVFVRPGAIIPGQKISQRLETGSYRDLAVTVYPGADGAYDLYEDDGISQDYMNKSFSLIPIRYSEQKTKNKITISPAKSSFDGFLKQRSLEIRIPFSVPPLEIKAGGKGLKWSYRLGDKGWTYDGDTATTIIRINKLDVTRGLVVEIIPHKTFPPKMLMGLKGLLARLECVRHIITVAAQGASAHPRERLAVEAAQTGNRISRNPGTALSELKRLREILARLPGEFRAMKRNQEDKDRQKLLAKCLSILKAARKTFPAFYK